MNIEKINNKRHIDYYVSPLADDLPKLLYAGANYSGYKLDIKKRHIFTDEGEVNFLIRDNSNNLKHIFLYGIMKNPNEIYSFKYYINTFVKLSNNNYTNVKGLLDDEIAKFYVLDFINNYVSKNYTII